MRRAPPHPTRYPLVTLSPGGERDYGPTPDPWSRVPRDLEQCKGCVARGLCSWARVRDMGATNGIGGSPGVGKAYNWAQ